MKKAFVLFVCLIGLMGVLLFGMQQGIATAEESGGYGSDSGGYEDSGGYGGIEEDDSGGYGGESEGESGGYGQ